MATRVVSLGTSEGSADKNSPELTSNPREAIRRFDELPEFVRHAHFTQVSERRMDSGLFNTIVSQTPNPLADKDWEDRLKRRHDALLPHVGKMLTCVFIRLPGVHYTIEVDPVSEEVVHWEWQAD